MSDAVIDRAESPSMPDRVGSKVILALLAVLVTLTAAGAGGIFLLKPGTAHAGRPVAEAVRPVANYARLPTMNFTLSDGNRLHELRVRVVLEMDPAVEAKAVDSFVPRITNALSTRMLDVDPAELRGGEGSLFIKDAVMQTAAKEMRPLKVRQVLVQEMLLR
ncbi:flagellar basal body-associated FliL family protein [Azospirillum soli]|uniref:flagellar basal body-associated FliL family protein n=1 Tax=Azospirillum soli TaxID=1304799 RepID=UPI001AE28D43|nr:flagellar basal body-associated FliL family protein [Azospirillum soli]MBP2312494.1 flagellar basal body-associated protein FliL [Azospirillum soli]